jgi:uncharacterized membrane protein YjgN (DUF898 family)
LDAAMDERVDNVPAAVISRSARVAFLGTQAPFRRLVVRGSILELFTAGFYRFWLATDMRRYLWSHTALEGDAPEYTGNAKELLIGFLFALAILVPIYLVYFLIGIEAERIKAFASIPLLLFFYAFGQFAIFRARRYRATRTVWRGTRFWMTGSGWNYSWRACLWSLLVVLTLGLALPWREAALERFKMRHTHYGDLAGRFEGKGWELFKRGWWLWLLSLLIVTLPFTYPAYKAISWKWWVDGIRFGALRFESDLRRGGLMGLYWAVIGWMTLFLAIDGALIGVIGAFTAVVVGGTKAQISVLTQFVRDHTYLVLAANAINYLIVALASGIVIRIYLLRGLWQRVASSTTVHNLEAADNVRTRGDVANALGEGFANSFDIVGF